MLVKFVGQGELSFEYNSKRYFFTRNTPPVDLPHAIYDYVKSARTVESQWLVPCELEPQVIEKPNSDMVKLIGQLKEEKKSLRQEVESLKDKILKLEKQVEKFEKSKKK